MKNLSKLSITTKSRFLVFSSGLSVLLATINGCLPIFPESTNQITEQTIQSIQPMQSTRVDVLLTLADPTIRGDQDNYFVYRWNHLHGGLVLFPGFPAAGDFINSCHHLVITFTPDGRVDRIKQFFGKSKHYYFPKLPSGTGSENIGASCDDPESTEAIDNWLIMGSDTQIFED